MFSIRFDPKEIQYWASQYPVADDNQVENIFAPQVKNRGYFTITELQGICTWKTPRSKSRVARNSEEFIQAVTKTALSTPDERLRIEVLTLLSGVKWPTASALLHLTHKDPYPILDFRALRSLGIDPPPINYTFDFWWDYTRYCRRLALQAGVTMRVLDRALWIYSNPKYKGGK
jgi:hypothetical protein